MAPIGIVILAAGASKRMGQPKQLLSYRGRSLIRRTAETALTTPYRPVIAVLGAEAERIALELEGLDVYPTLHFDWARGPGSSIAAGVQSLLAIAPEVEAVVILLCDQPLLTAAHIAALVNAYRSRQALAAASQYGQTIGVPALFSRVLFPQLIGLPPERGAQTLLAQYAADICAIPFPGGELDIDTQQDWQRLETSPSDFQES